ncbi:hypothetical protein HG66A1_44990 [Gimesia chilikensis]|uniref:Uncharacterized protein n=1 Tax=Gimesia chilikensis TaxID=2605989 RepID=A0A517PTI5_9PLAN|nr:hypothetical protein HG66A1_44990 [Gimesia chilikensis]
MDTSNLRLWGGYYIAIPEMGQYQETEQEVHINTHLDFS